MRGWIQNAIWLRIAYLKVILLDSEMLVFLSSCQRSLTHWYCILTPNSGFCYVLKQPKRRATPTIQCGGGISSRSVVGTRLVTKTMPHIAIGSQGSPYWGPGVSREAVFIDLH